MMAQPALREPPALPPPTPMRARSPPRGLSGSTAGELARRAVALGRHRSWTGAPSPDERAWPRGWALTSRDPLRAHDGCVHAIHPYHRDTRVLSCGEDGTLRRHDLLTGLPIGQPIEGHDGPVNDCCVFPGGDRALSCGADKTLRVWELTPVRSACRKVIHTEHGGPATACCLIPTQAPERPRAPTREYALTASTDGTLKVWDLDEGRLMFTLQTGSGAVESCCVFTSAVGGKFKGQIHALSGGHDNHVRRWSLDDLEGSSFTNAKDRQIVHRDKSPWLAKHNPMRGKLGHSGIVNCCVVSQDGIRALTCGGDRTAIYWDLTTGEALRLLNDPHSGARMNNCSLMPKYGLGLTVSAFGPRLWDMHSGELLRTFCGHTNDVTDCQAILGGTKALTCDNCGTVRVWDISQGNNAVDLATEEGHSHVVKELCIIPGEKLKALSCSYDKTAKVWDLTTGSCLATLTGHTGNVNQCCAFPAPADGQQIRRVLTGSGDRKIKIWDWPSETCELTLGGEQHTGEVRGCGVFDGGRKVYSCSKDSTICVFMLAFDERTQKLLSGHLILKLEGHTGLVDRCAVYRQGTRMISASWDKTSKVWDLEKGTELMTLHDDNKVRGVVVYAEEKRAVTAGSGDRLKVWNLETGEIVDEVLHNHMSTVWGLRMLNETQRLVINGVWKEVPVVVTYSNDGMIKAWKLLDGATSEIVHARRGANSPMCVAVLPSTYRLGKLPILVGGFKSITLVDMSHVGTGPSAGSIWAGKSCMQLNQWIDWILDVIEESSVHFLYAHERGAELPTMIHKLAAHDDGHAVLERILSHFAADRAAILGGEYVPKLHANALGTIGMLSRAGRGTKRSTALVVATEESQEDIAQLLLDDHRDHVSKLSLGVPAAEVSELTEGDLLLLFQNFPSLAADFLADLPLLRTQLVRPQSKCRFSNVDNGRFVRASTVRAPHVGQFDDASFMLWWEEVIDREWERCRQLSGGRNKMLNKMHCLRQEIVGRVVNLLEDETGIDLDGNGTVGNLDPQQSRQRRHADRMKDSAWGVKVSSYLVPIRGGTTNLDDMRLNDTEPRIPTEQEEEETLQVLTRGDDDREALLETPVDGGPPTMNLFTNIARNVRRAHVDSWEEETCQPSTPSHRHLPFSQLLQACCDHAVRVDSPAVFGSASLQAIIQYKWQLISPIYEALRYHYCAFVGLFTLTTIFFHDLTCGSDNCVGDAKFRRWLIDPALERFSPGWYRACGGWLLFFSTVALGGLLIRSEMLQFRFHKMKWLHDGLNWWDLSSLVFSFSSLVWVCVRPLDATPAGGWVPDPDDPGARPLFIYHSLRTLRAVALFTTWINLFQWFQGSETHSFVFTVLLDNIKSLWEVGIVLLLLMASFSLAFIQLLGDDHAIEQNGFAGPYDEFSRSLRTALGMTLGDFDSDIYLDQNGAAPSLSFALFALYMVIVTIIMMNLLIAGMQQSYERVLETRHLFMLQQRAERLVEVEEILLTYEEKENAGNTQPEHDDEHDDELGLPTGIERVVKAILRIPMAYSEYRPYMHTLSEVKLDLTSGGSEAPAQWQGRMTEVGLNAAAQVESGSVGQTIKRLEQRTEAIEATMKQMNEEALRADQKLSEVMGALADIKVMIQLHPQQT